MNSASSHIDASHSRQPLVKGERLVRYEVNAVKNTKKATLGGIPAKKKHHHFGQVSAEVAINTRFCLKINQCLESGILERDTGIPEIMISFNPSKKLDTLPETNSSPLKKTAMPHSETRSYSKTHLFSGAF